jgi:cytochrome P450
MTIGGRRPLAGTVVATSIVLAHRRLPRRRGVQSEPRRRGGAEHSAPFGDVRRCIGAGFSLLEVGTVLREILTVTIFRFRPTAGPSAARSATSPRCRAVKPGWSSAPETMNYVNNDSFHNHHL